MNTNLTVTRNMRNEIECTNYFETKKPEYKIRVSTWKGSRGVATNFQAVQLNGNVESFIMFQDFSKTINHLELKRATEKNILEGQKIALSKLDEIMQEFNQHYKITN